jgi:hypothetical protein
MTDSNYLGGRAAPMPSEMIGDHVRHYQRASFRVRAESTSESVMPAGHDA